MSTCNTSKPFISEKDGEVGERRMDLFLGTRERPLLSVLFYHCQRKVSHRSLSSYEKTPPRVIISVAINLCIEAFS